VKTISLKKRIALVAVAALGSTLVTVAPANAAVNAVGDVLSINLTRQTSSPVVGSAVKVNVGLVTGANSASTEVPLTAVLTKYPSAGFVQTTASIRTATGSTATANFGFDAGSATASGAVLTLGPTAGARALTAGSVASSSTVGAGSFSFTPTVAGDYELTVWNDTGTNSSVVDTNESRQTISITVVAAPVATGGASILNLTSGTGTLITAGSTGDTSIAPAVRTLATIAGGAGVVVRGSTGAALNGATVAASISGAGMVLVDTSTTATAGTARSSSVSTGTSNIAYVHVSGDGTAGTGTVTVTVTDAVSGASSTVGTFTVQFYSSTVATLTATQVYSVLGAARTTGCAAVACTWTTYSTGSAGKPAVSIVAKDSGGNVIPGLTLSATISDAAVIGSSTIVAVTDATNDYVGLGGYNASVTGATGVASGKTATVTYTYTNADLTKISSAAIPFTTGGTTIVTETLAFDKTSYAPGEAMVVTRTAKDSAGNSVADGVASPAVTFSKPNGGTAPAAGVYVAGKSATSATTPTVFAPATGGAFTASMTGGDAAATVRTASSSVTDANAGLLTQIDALNAKIVALNALIAKIMKKLGVK
jgi:hypothetical protein